jgi:hypothetical protein
VNIFLPPQVLCWLCDELNFGTCEETSSLLIKDFSQDQKNIRGVKDIKIFILLYRWHLIYNSFVRKFVFM